MKDYEIIGGHYIKKGATKEDLLDLIINIMSSRGDCVCYKMLKTYSKEELINKLKNLDKQYNCVVYEYDINEHCIINKGVYSCDNGGCSIKYAGKTICVHTKNDYILAQNERIAEGNTLTEQEKRLLKEFENEKQ